MAHEIPYVATATVAELRDLEAKVDPRDGASTGRVTCTCSCPARWGGARATAETILIARLAKESGLFPVFEADRRARRRESLRSAARCR